MAMDYGDTFDMSHDARPDRRQTDWMWNEVNSLRTEITAQHRGLRSDMNAGFAKLSHDISERVSPLERRAEDHSTRLTIIETERKSEQAQAIKRGTYAAIIVTTSMQALWKILEHFWK